MSESMSAQVVVPARHTPPVPRPWQQMGLPASGWVMLFDLVLCAGCQTADVAPCTQGCVDSHHLPPPPQRARGTVGPVVCNQCTEPVCATACPVGAIGQSHQGVVTVDQELCIGCRFCEDVCPVDGFTYIDPYTADLPAYPPVDYSSDRPDGRFANTVAKCTFCTDRVLAGSVPVCVESCPQGAIHIGNLELNTVTNGRLVGRLDELLAARTQQPRAGAGGVTTRVIDLL